MAKTVIYLDDGRIVRTAMSYSDVLNSLTNINQSTLFVEFTSTDGDKGAISPHHVVEVYEPQDQQGVNNGQD